MEITGISKSIDVERLTSERSTLLGIGTRQYVKVVFYVDLNQNRRKVKVKGVYVDVINIYGLTGCDPQRQWLGSFFDALIARPASVKVLPPLPIL